MSFAIAFLVTLLVLSILIFSITLNSTTSVSAIEVKGVGVYWDINCNNEASSIDWGTLNPGSVKNIAVYVRNEGEEPTYLILSTTNWNPPKASDYITLRYNYTGQQIDPGEALQITLTLSISRYIEGISSFGFDILLTGSDHLWGDVNGNGVVGSMDFGDVGKMYLIYSGVITGPPELIERGDINRNGVVGPTDFGDVITMFLIYNGNTLVEPPIW
jgi:hypothetical protein